MDGDGDGDGSWLGKISIHKGGWGEGAPSGCRGSGTVVMSLGCCLLHCNPVMVFKTSSIITLLFCQRLVVASWFCSFSHIVCVTVSFRYLLREKHHYYLGFFFLLLVLLPLCVFVRPLCFCFFMNQSYN